MSTQSADVLMDLTDAIAQAVAEWKGLPKGAAVEVPEDATAELNDQQLRSLRVWVLDASEVIHQVDGEMVEDLEVLIVCQQKLDKRAEAAPLQTQVRALSAVAGGLARLFVGAVLDCGRDAMGAAACVAIERKRARDHQDLVGHGKYYAEILTHWRRGAD